MARQSKNRVMQGTRGMFGKQVVFKIRKGKQFVAAPPEIDENRKPTPNQQKSQAKFKRSSEYASEAIKDAKLKKAYQKVAGRRQTAQNIALRDAYYPPEILSIITQGYIGGAGNIIVVHAVDDFKVTRVRVSILNKNKELIEEGEALTDKNDMIWVYTVKLNNDNIKGCVVKTMAYDLPGNESIKDVML